MDLGEKAEDLAVEYLARNGYQILERNWYYRHKEIDIVARDGDLLVIVEVKGRGGRFLKHPEEAVSMKKQRYLIEAANAYIEKHDLDVEVRFDIISVIFQGNAHRLYHIDDAFYPIVNKQ